MLMKEFLTTTLFVEEIHKLPHILEEWQGTNCMVKIENVSVIQENLVLIISSKTMNCNETSEWVNDSTNISIDQRIIGPKQ